MSDDRLKFRAWDKTNREWYMNGDCFDLNFSGSYGDFYFDNDNPANMRDVKLEWFQSINRKDKHGKLIFDGSILRVFDWGHTTASMELGITSVEWCDDEKGWRYADGDITEDAYDQFRNVEIIGHIKKPRIIK